MKAVSAVPHRGCQHQICAILIKVADPAGSLLRSVSVREDMLGSGVGALILSPPPQLLQQHSLPAGEPLPMSPPPPVPQGARRSRAHKPKPEPSARPATPGSLGELEAFWAAGQRGADPNPGPGLDPEPGSGAGAPAGVHSGGVVGASPELPTPEGAYTLFPECFQARTHAHENPCFFVLA